MTTPRRALPLGGMILLLGCPAAETTPSPTSPTSPTSPPTSRPAPTTRPVDSGRGQIEGKAHQRKMRIWGEVRLIKQKKHAKLPELEQKKGDSAADPRVTLVNDTPYGLTGWLAGPCVAKLEIKPRTQKEVDVCPGTYLVAAQVSTESFLPLVRENQLFAQGTRYTLRIQIKTQPKTIRRKRWITE